MTVEWDWAQIFCFVLVFLSLLFSFARPMAIASIYLVLSNFFVLDLPIPLPFFSSSFTWNTSKIYAVGIICYFGYCFFIKKQERISPHPLYRYYAIGIFFSIFIPTFSHLYFWKLYPGLFSNPLLKSLWGLGIFFIPKQKLSLEKFAYYLFWGFLVSLILITPESVSYYLQEKEGLGRYLVASNSKPLFLGLGKKYWFAMDDNTCENFGILSIPLVFSFWNSLFSLQKRAIFLYGFIFIYYLGILYINQYLTPILLLMIHSGICVGRNVFLEKNQGPSFLRRGLILGVCAFFLFAFGHILEHFLIRFTVLEKTLQATSVSQKMDNSNRVSVFLHSFFHLSEDILLKGVGLIRDYESTKTPFPGGESHLTYHSTFLDFIISFGLPVGLIANFIFLFPFFLFFVPKLRPILRVQGKEGAFGFLIFLTIFILSFESIYGRESLQLGVAIFFSSLFLFFCTEQEQKMK